MRLVWVLLVAGCLVDRTVPCGDLVCPVGSTCTVIGCASPSQLAACAGIADGTTCEANDIGGVCTSGVCELVICGDGKVEGPEKCDDGNQRSGDGCSADCLSNETCGNGYVDFVKGEQCDDGLAGLSHDGCTSTCQIEFDAWADATPQPPPPRQGHAMAYDSKRKRVVMFGGFDVGPLGDTWEWDGLTWRQIVPPVSPSPRGYAAMAYDADRGVVVLFGGDDPQTLGDTWEWDGIVWTERTPATTAPSPRYSAAFGFDASRHQLVLYGGLGTLGASETWLWDGTDWHDLTTTASEPEPNGLLAYDAQGQQLLLYTCGYPTLGATWTWNGTSWDAITAAPLCISTRALSATHGGDVALLFTFDQGGGYSHSEFVWANGAWPPMGTANAPSSRASTQMAYDEDVDQLVLFGGDNEVMTTSTRLGDTWIEKTSGGAWTQETLPTPTARWSASLAYQPLRGTIVMYGGTSTLADHDTWEWDGLAWTDRSTGSTNPGDRSGPCMVATRDHVVLFGGSSSDQETWLWDGSLLTWTDVTMTKPPARTNSPLAYDTRRDRVVMFGGHVGAVTSQDTWEWDGTDWMPMSSTQTPPARMGAALVYDERREVTVLFGGTDVLGNPIPADTWTWDGSEWTPQTPAASPPAGAVVGTYDPLRGTVVVIVTGLDNAVATWEWDGTTWTERAIVTAPSPRLHPSIVYDNRHAELVMFGGALDETSGPLQDVWTEQYSSVSYPADACIDVDTDGDGLVGCADPDCWARCTPLCPPRSSCDPSAPHCGDGICSVLEDARLCPEDCSQ
ncbi:MAG TPA: DUF4215 domain-containing protein [Kofleriaceae bacterium]|nr:DUF4215 domain-containing protein [Kofleriaceae bacterium]